MRARGWRASAWSSSPSGREDARRARGEHSRRPAPAGRWGWREGAQRARLECRCSRPGRNARAGPRRAPFAERRKPARVDARLPPAPDAQHAEEHCKPRELQNCHACDDRPCHGRQGARVALRPLDAGETLAWCVRDEIVTRRAAPRRAHPRPTAGIPTATPPARRTRDGAAGALPVGCREAAALRRRWRFSQTRGRRRISLETWETRAPLGACRARCRSAAHPEKITSQDILVTHCCSCSDAAP